MENISKILSHKPRNFHTISPRATVSDALAQMCCENTDHLIVMDNDEFRGIVTEHDIASKAMTHARSFDTQKVSDVMYTGIPILTVSDSVNRCVRLMQQHNIRYLPVFDDYRFAGVISADDILQVMMFGNNRFEDLESEAINSYVC